MLLPSRSQSRAHGRIQRSRGYGQAQLTHALGLAFRLYHRRISEAVAFMFSTLNVPVELHDAVIHKFEGGGIGTISSASAHLGTNTNTHQVTVHVVGNERQFSIDLNRSYVYVHYANGAALQPCVSSDAGHYSFFGPANGLVDVTLGKKEAFMAPGEPGAITVEALEMAYQSGSVGAIAQIKQRGT